MNPINRVRCILVRPDGSISKEMWTDNLLQEIATPKPTEVTLLDEGVSPIGPALKYDIWKLKYKESKGGIEAYYLLEE